MKFIFKLIKRIFILIFILSILAGIAVGYAFFIEPNQLSVKNVDISSDEVSTDIKVAVFADTHFGEGYTIEDFDKAVDRINDADVDFVIFMGDLIDDFSSYDGNVNEISRSLSNIKASKGKFAVYGNHDYGGGAENYYEPIMTNGGFTVLVNEMKSFTDLNMTILGVDDFLLGSGNTSVVNKLPTNTFNLVICHEPDVFDNFNRSKISLMAAGHSHGGQINLPYLRDEILPSLGSKYIKGSFTVDDSLLYVNPGLGTTKVNARLFAKPEITIFNIN